MKACLRLHQNALVFATPCAKRGITFHGSHSQLIGLARRLGAGWTARTRVLILGCPNPTPEQREIARQIVRRCHYYHYEMVVGDRRGIDETVVAECNRWGVMYRTFGTNVRPLNGGRRYVGIICERGLSMAGRDAVRVNWLISEADVIYSFRGGLSLNTRGKDVIRL